MDWSGLIGGIIGGVIGVAGGVSATVLSNRNARRLSREERIDNRRANAYIELEKAVTAVMMPVAQYLATAVPGSPLPSIPGDPFVLARGFVLQASPDVRRLYREVVTAFTTFVGQKGAPIAVRRTQFAVVERAAFDMELQIALEMSPTPSSQANSDDNPAAAAPAQPWIVHDWSWLKAHLWHRSNKGSAG